MIRKIEGQKDRWLERQIVKKVDIKKIDIKKIDGQKDRQLERKTDRNHKNTR